MTVSITISSPFVGTPSSSSSTIPIWTTFGGTTARWLLNCQDCSIQLQIQPSITLKSSSLPLSEERGWVKYHSLLLPLQLRRSARSCSQTIPEALAKIWRAAGSEVKAFSYMVRKLRSIAFQRCIWRGGLSLVEMAENEDFLQKKVWKTAF